MAEILHQPSVSQSPLEICESGIMFVTPLSEENQDKAHTLVSDLNAIVGREFWTPHLDITHGRILEMQSGTTREQFDRIVSLSGLALCFSRCPIQDVTATLDRVIASEEAIIALATQGTEPIGAQRHWMVTNLKNALSKEPEVKVKVKRYNSAHATVARPPAGEARLSQAEIDIVNARTSHFLEKHPIVQPIDRIIIAAENEKYVLDPRLEIALR